jgi:hypothetical protein
VELAAAVRQAALLELEVVHRELSIRDQGAALCRASEI